MNALPMSSRQGVVAFRRWTRAQDAGRLLAALRVRPLAGFLLRGTALVGIVAWAPGVHAFFAMPLPSALACFLPCAVHRVAFACVHARHRRVVTTSWLTWLPGLALEHFFLAGLVALAVLPGALALGVLLIGTSAVHGRRYRVTWREPFLLAGTLAALLGAAALAWHEQRWVPLAIAGPSALVAQLYVGALAVRYDQARADADRLRAAVHAQLVEQQERDVGRLTQAMAEILGHHQGMDQALHDAGTAADMMKAFGTQRGMLARTGFEDQARQLQDSLRQLQEMVKEVRAKSRRFAGTEPESVDLGLVLESVQAQVSLRFPDVDIHVELEPTRPPRALVRGGPLTLRRVVENLVVNACEGNGEQGASRVFIRARTEPLSGRLEVEIEDDGPGFPPERLSAPAEELYTTKAQGTGLGLYTSECLLRASGGLLHRHNGPGGGALLRILLPREYQ